MYIAVDLAPILTTLFFSVCLQVSSSCSSSCSALRLVQAGNVQVQKSYSQAALLTVSEIYIVVQPFRGVISTRRPVIGYLGELVANARPESQPNYKRPLLYPCSRRVCVRARACVSLLNPAWGGKGAATPQTETSLQHVVPLAGEGERGEGCRRVHHKKPTGGSGNVGEECRLQAGQAGLGLWLAEKAWRSWGWEGA